jgi:tetratricopeptide (TPR) repeat protein
MQLVGAGLGLYGLRAIPMIGREPEREALWDALRRVRTTGRAHYVLVRGAAGLGKSRLVQWLTERAHEVGAAEVVRTVLGREEGRDDAVQRLIARTLRTAKLSRPDAVERIEDFLAGRGAVDDDLVLALAELAQAAPSPTSTLSDTGKLRVLRLSSATERHVTARRFLASLGAHRPAIAWFDDVQHSDDSLALAEHLLDERDTHPTPVLVVHTLREEALGEHPALAARIDALLARPGATQVHLDPLDAGATAGLVRGLLGLHDALAVQVEERSAGNPAFAVQLVGDWVARRVLEVGREGFVLRAGEAAQLPDDIFAVWQARIDQLLEGLPEEARTHLERAAILGLSVNEEEWQEACDDPEGAKKQWVGGSRVALTMTGLRTRATLSERLAEAHLVEETDVGWSFLHGMLRETLERGAREAGRWADHHRACASMLRRLELDDASERLGRHLLEAGDLVGALPSLMAGAREAWTLRGVRPALGVLAQAEEVMGWLGLPDSDPVRGEALRLRCQMMQFQGETSEAERLARVAVEAAREHAWTRLLPEALFELGVVLLQQRRFEEAEPLLLQANDLAGSISNLPLLGRTFLELGRLSRRRGDYKEAARLVQGARRCFQTTGDRVALANALETLGDVARDAGKKKSAWDLYTSAAKLAEECGSREVLAGAVLSRGEMLRQAGELDHARKEYQRALALYEAVGAWRAVLCRINLGLLYLEAGRARAARQIVDEGLPALGPTKRPHLLAAAHLILAACAGSSREWALWDRHWAAADELLQATRFTDADLARIAAIAAEQAAQAEEKPRAVIAAALATAQYRAVGREAEAASISEAARAWLPS